jgi:hypothetical protein
MKITVLVSQNNPFFTPNPKVPWLPNNGKRRCPAIILAASRIAKVKGRITDLTDTMYLLHHGKSNQEKNCTVSSRKATLGDF